MALLWAGLALAVGSTPDTAAVDRAGLRVAPAAPSGLQAEIQAILADRDAEIARLRVEFRAAATETGALAIQRRIEASQHRAGIAVLEAQIPWAEKRGDTAAVERLEGELAVLRDAAPAREVER